ncbi:hypothetical protein AAL_08375 [Moelleriella libera RCEF 2490]|uniref:Uncharacterized protein n=1 Tax=Moelleriella libera RCEF 2490 TaxID=1081109 RepID=A0A167VFP3_9HYPO|nr:hypothetical protein AAL_08375 [Moelleriella libera RCEF 2490]
MSKPAYRMVEEPYCGKFSLSPKDGLPAHIGSDGATMCIVLFVPTRQGNAIVGHIDSKFLIKKDSGPAFDRLVADAEKRIRSYLGTDTVDPKAKWVITDNADKKFGKAVRLGVQKATGLRPETLATKQRDGFMIKVTNGKPSGIVWATGNGIPGYSQLPVKCATTWTNTIEA